MDDPAICIPHECTHDSDARYESNTTRHYYYDTPAGGDGASSPVLPQVVEIKDGSGHTTDQFVWGPAYVDELLLHERDADGDPNHVLEQRLYAAHDTLYSVLELVDENGTVVERYSYSPYGADPTDPRKGVARITDADENELTPEDSVGRYLYTGRQFDKAIGLNYHRARRLSHNLGRWTRRDPLGVKILPAGPSATPVEQYRDGVNLYQYVRSRPMAFADPGGLVCGVTVHRANVRLYWDDGARLNVGHEWIEFDGGEGGSMGFWPKSDTIKKFGSQEGRVASPDDKKGDRSGQTWETDRRTQGWLYHPSGESRPGTLWPGKKTGLPKEIACRCASCEQIRGCLGKVRDFYKQKKVRWSLANHNCRDFVKNALSLCCLKRK